MPKLLGVCEAMGYVHCTVQQPVRKKKRANHKYKRIFISFQSAINVCRDIVTSSYADIFDALFTGEFLVGRVP